MKAIRVFLWYIILESIFIFIGLSQSQSAVQEQLNNLDLNLVGTGARAEGLGGAFIGLADDATAVLWNPAGLATLERPEASVVVRNISQKAEFADPTQFFGGNNTQSFSQFGLNFGSAAYPIRSGSGNNIVLALAYQQQINLNQKVNSTNWWGTGKIDNTGGANTITPGIGVKLFPALSVGVAANFWMGSVDRSEIDDGIDTAPDSTGVFQQVGTYTANYSQTLKLSGTNFVFGALVDLAELKGGIPLRLGISLKTPFTLKAQGTLTANAIDTYYGNSSYSGDITMAIHMPLMLGFGASYQFGDNLVLAVDYEMREFKDKQLEYSTPFGTTTQPTTEQNVNLNQFRIGAEYLFVTNLGVFPIRVGYRTVPTVLANQTNIDQQSPQFSGEVIGSAISFGTGYIADHYALDVAYTITSYTQTLDWGDPSQVDTNNYYPSNTKYSIGSFTASLIFYF
jgi:opacity protein-like surface antigen